MSSSKRNSGRASSFQLADDQMTAALNIKNSNPELYGEGEIGFLPRGLIQTSLPYKLLKNADGTLASHFVRTSKNVELTLSSSSLHYGLPYGTYGRLVFARLTSQAVEKRTPVIDLGASISEMIQKFGKVAGGGARGPNQYFLNALRALGSTSIYLEWKREEERRGKKGVRTDQRLFPILSQVSLWSDEKTTDAVVELSPYMISELNEAVPFYFDKLIQLANSPMRMDIYVWATYRASYMRGTLPVQISWEALQGQFGPDFSRTRDFRRAFAKNLAEVMKLYTTLRVEEYDKGIKMYPSPPDVPRKESMYIDKKAKDIISNVPSETKPEKDILMLESDVWFPDSVGTESADKPVPDKVATATNQTAPKTKAPEKAKE